MRAFLALVVRRPIGASFVALAVFVLGFVGREQLRESLLPPVELPVLTVRAERDGSSAAEIEERLLQPLEEHLGTLPGLVGTDGMAKAGAVEVRLSLRADADLDAVLNRLRERLGGFRTPPGTTPIRVLRYDPGDEPLLRLTLQPIPGETDLAALATATRDELVPQLEGLAPVAGVRVRGGSRRELELIPDPAALAAAGLGLADLRRAIESGISSATVGSVTGDEGTQAVRLRGPAVEPRHLVALPVTAELAVGDLARVELVESEPEEFAVGTGPGGAVDELLVIEVLKQADARAIAAADLVRAAIGRFAASEGDDAWRYGGGRLRLIDDAAAPIRRAVDEVQKAVLVGAGLASLVLLGFFLLAGLRRARRGAGAFLAAVAGGVAAAAVVFVAVPLSVFATFLAMSQFGVGINLMSLGGLALGVGMLVDNAIVVLEAAARERERDGDRHRAVVRGVGRVATAVVASTLTTVAVFLPLAFVPGVLGDLFVDQAFTVSASLLASLVVALALVPPLVALARPGRPRTDLRPSVLGRAYAAVVAGVVRVPLLAPLLLVAVVALGIGVAADLPLRLLPPTTKTRFVCDVHLPRDHDVRRSAAWATDFLIELQRRSDPGLAGIAIAGEDPRSAPTLARRDDDEVRLVLVRDAPAADVAAERAWLAGLERAALERGALSAVAVAPPLVELGRHADRALAVALRGGDPEELREVALRWRTMLRAAGARGVTSSAEELTEEFVVLGDPAAMLEAGVTWEHLREVLAAATGSAEIEGFRPRYDGTTPSTTPLTVRLEGHLRGRRADALRRLDVGTGDAEIPLGRVADIERRTGDGLIVHRDSIPVATIEATALPGPVDEVLADLRAREPLPPGVEIVDFGLAVLTGDSLRAMALLLALAVFMVLVVMAVQFESIAQPLLVLVSVPMAAAGAIPALALAGQGLDVMSGIGLVVLTGIAVNNAIVLVSTANQLRDDGRAPRDAIVEAARSRLRPILMTTATTVIGLLPLALGWGEAAELRTPLAIAVIGGLAVSTVMVLVVLPGILALVMRAPKTDAGGAEDAEGSSYQGIRERRTP